MHHSFAWCFFFYLSFLFPPVEPGVFNCCVTSKRLRTAIDCPQSFIIESYFLNIFLYHGSDSVVSVVAVEALLLEAMGVV